MFFSFARSSVTRMSGGQKQNVMAKTSEQEKAVLVAEEKTGNSSSSSSEGETTDSETGNLSQLNFGGRIHGERQNISHHNCFIPLLLSFLICQTMM